MARLKIVILLLAVIALCGCGTREERARKLFNQGKYDEVARRYAQLEIGKLASERAAAKLVSKGLFREALAKYPETRVASDTKLRLDEQIAESLLAVGRYQDVLSSFAHVEAAQKARKELAKQAYEAGRLEELVSEYRCTPAWQSVMNSRADSALSAAAALLRKADRLEALQRVIDQYAGTPAASAALNAMDQYVDVHCYQFCVVDVTGAPISDAEVSYTVTFNKTSTEDDTLLTACDGRALVPIQVPRDKRFTFGSVYLTDVRYRVTREGFNPCSGVDTICSSSFRGRTDKSHYYARLRPTRAIQTRGPTDVVLLRPIDYFDQVFLTTEDGLVLKPRILDFLDMIQLQGLLGDAILVPGTIDLVTFKDKKYLRLAFSSAQTYNALKMNKYDIGKTLFDEIVRKVLTPLNALSDSTSFWGYDLLIRSSTKSFLDETGSPESLEYRFLIPEAVVRKYKNKDIGGQQVLDSSYVLLNDERIELKLQ
jgi:hypothetical protein